jgi:hypothetical protein
MSELPFLTLLTFRQSGNIHRTASNIQSLTPRFRAVGVLIPHPENNHDRNNLDQTAPDSNSSTGFRYCIRSPCPRNPRLSIQLTEGTQNLPGASKITSCFPERHGIFLLRW